MLILACMPAVRSQNSPPSSASAVLRAGLFPHTQWSQIAGAGDADSPAAMEALDCLARAYWQPLYVFARQQGATHEAAADAVQGFLARLLTREGMRRIERRETRFRSLLITAFKNWLNDVRSHNRAQKRGGGMVIVPLEDFDSMRTLPVANAESPEQAFDRQWARTLYDRVMVQLSAAQDHDARAEYFAALRAAIFGGGKRGTLEEIAARFDMNGSAVRKAAQELRSKFGRLLRAEVERVVSAPAEIDAELRYLLELLSK